MLTGVLPGNGLFIIAGCTFLFLFCASKKEKEEKIFLPLFAFDSKSGKKIKANLMRYVCYFK